MELITFENVTISSAGLTGSRADSRQQATGLELLTQSLLQNSLGVSGGNLGLNVAGLLDGLGRLSWGGVGLLRQVDTVVLLVPMSEGSGIDLNDRVLGQSLRADQLLVGGVVNSVQDSSLVSGVLSGPHEVAGIEPHSAEFHVSTTTSDGVNSLVTNLRVSSWSTELELSLLLMDVSASSSSSDKM